MNAPTKANQAEKAIEREHKRKVRRAAHLIRRIVEAARELDEISCLARKKCGE